MRAAHGADGHVLDAAELHVLEGIIGESARPRCLSFNEFCDRSKAAFALFGIDVTCTARARARYVCPAMANVARSGGRRSQNDAELYIGRQAVIKCRVLGCGAECKSSSLRPSELEELSNLPVVGTASTCAGFGTMVVTVASSHAQVAQAGSPAGFFLTPTELAHMRRHQHSIGLSTDRVLRLAAVHRVLWLLAAGDRPDVTVALTGQDFASAAALGPLVSPSAQRWFQDSLVVLSDASPRGARAEQTSSLTSTDESSPPLATRGTTSSTIDTSSSPRAGTLSDSRRDHRTPAHSKQSAPRRLSVLQVQQVVDASDAHHHHDSGHGAAHGSDIDADEDEDDSDSGRSGRKRLRYSDSARGRSLPVGTDPRCVATKN